VTSSEAPLRDPTRIDCLQLRRPSRAARTHSTHRFKSLAGTQSAEEHASSSFELQIALNKRILWRLIRATMAAAGTTSLAVPDLFDVRGKVWASGSLPACKIYLTNDS